MGGGWLGQNHKKCIELASFSCFGKREGREQVASDTHKKHIKLSAFSWFGKWAGRGRVASESYEMNGTVNMFMVLEVGGTGAARLRIIRNVND